MLLSDKIEKGKPFKLSYLDLNQFKQLNDSFGHDIGDFALQTFSECVKANMTDDHLFARMGGDEFIIVLFKNDSDAQSDTQFWQNLDQDLKKPVATIDGTDVFVSYACGTATYPEDANTLDSVIMLADRRMYKNKHS